MELKVYTTKELLEELNISVSSWERRRADLLEWFKYFFNYEIICLNGNQRAYNITQIYADYEPLPRKKKTEEIKSFYREKTAKVVDKQPLNTGSNIARIIISEDNKYDHAELTATRYVRPIINEDYDRSEYYWCFINYQTQEYELLTEEQTEYLRECFNTADNAKTKVEEAMKYIDAYYNNNLDQETAQKLVFTDMTSHYERAMDKFKNKYGQRPMVVPMLVSKENAFDKE